MAGSVYHKNTISILIQQLLLVIMEQSLKKVLLILKDTFNFFERAEKDLEIGTVFETANIKSLYTNISCDLGLKVLEYWIGKWQRKIGHLQRFTNNFILEGMSIILKNSYF